MKNNNLLKKQKINTACSVIQYVSIIIAGLVLPREILSHYGSEMNGLVHSITQFLSYTVLVELGIEAVIPAALYQPLAENDNKRVSAIFSSGYKIYRRIALICILYVAVLFIVFPKASGISAASMLVVVIGLETIIHYTIGTPERLLIISDQKGYVVYLISAVSTVIKTVFQIILIRTGSSIIIVKLVGTLISICLLVFLYLYVRFNYQIERRIKYITETIPKKWDGVAQHIAYFILENTDIVLLTLFAGFKEVSVYSIYFLVVQGVRKIFMAVTSSVQPTLGELLAKNDEEELRRFFAKFERWIHICTSIAFGAMGVLLVSFVRVYTRGINDVNYIRPVFAVLLVTAYGIQSIRDPYDKLILASGHFKETRINYIIAACLNFGISIVAVNIWGMEGVAFGTLIAMLFQAVYMIIYDSRILLKRSVGNIFLCILIDILILISVVAISMLLKDPFEITIGWILNALT